MGILFKSSHYEDVRVIVVAIAIALAQRPWPYTPGERGEVCILDLLVRLQLERQLHRLLPHVPFHRKPKLPSHCFLLVGVVLVDAVADLELDRGGRRQLGVVVSRRRRGVRFDLV